MAAKDVAVIEHKITISKCAGAVVGIIRTSPRTGKSPQQLQRNQIVSERLAIADDPKNIVRQCRRRRACKHAGNGAKRCPGGGIQLPDHAVPRGINVPGWADCHRATTANAVASALP